MACDDKREIAACQLSKQCNKIIMIYVRQHGLPLNGFTDCYSIHCFKILLKKKIQGKSTFTRIIRGMNSG